jgi:2-keto-4-pentenoate hydratase/2-oxohepta-3-ene-1,7-dioic acid hydratase in catechol pathway
MLSAGFSSPSFAQAQPIKLFRFGSIENEKSGIITADGKRYDVSAFGEDYNEAFFSKNGIARLQDWFEKNKVNCPEVSVSERIASCITRPSKIVAIGLNYLEHVREGGTTVPKEPVIFLKAPSSLSGPFDNVVIPRNSLKTDYEVELAIVIGKKASYVSQQDALNYVAGYTIINDYSEREWQLERPAGQWDKGKSSDTFAPLGPYLVTPQEIGDAQKLTIWLTVNGKRVQESNTSEMIFRIERLISEASRYMTLLPGDVIATGTPSGVGLGQKPPRYLKHGDVVELGIEKLGTQKQTLISSIQYYLGEEAYKDYQAWVALGLGGIPHTFEGYQTMKQLGTQMKDPLDVNRVASGIGKKGDVTVLKNLPKRKGTKPTIAPFAVPHRQVDQHNDSITRLSQKIIFDEQVANPTYNLQVKLSGKA